MSPDVWSSPAAALAGVWVAAGLTLMAFTYLVGDNPLYRIVEHLLIGIAAAYGLVVAVQEVLLPHVVAPLGSGAGYALLPGLALGLLLLTPGSARHRSWGTLAVAFLVGTTAGLGLSGALSGTLVPQTLAAAGLLRTEVIGGAGLLSGLVAVAGTVLTLLYFHLGERPSLGPWALPSRLWAGLRGSGYLLLMATLGGLFAATAGSRFALLVARLDFLLSQWLHLI